MSILQVNSLSIRFGGLLAVDSLSFSVPANKIVCLVGPNGAGKSTVFNMVSRFYQPLQGSITFLGLNLLNYQAHQLAGLGIGRTFQNIELFEQASLLTNLLSAQHSLSTTSLWSEMLFTRKVRHQEIAFRKRAEEMIDFFELTPFRHTKIADLPYGQRKLTELARALSIYPKLLLLDEPSSGLNQEETDDLSHWIVDIRDAFGTTVLMIDHNMNLVNQTADIVVAMAQGQKIASGLPHYVQSHPEVIAAYLGSEHV